MDQRIVAGLGNIYVCEALFRAGLDPCKRRRAPGHARPASRRRRAERLVAAIRAVLAEAIAAGGSSLRDYRQADGSLGYFQHRSPSTAAKASLASSRGCRGMVRAQRQAGRSTFYCPVCQR